jgi:hypothetical protein
VSFLFWYLYSGGLAVWESAGIMETHAHTHTHRVTDSTYSLLGRTSNGATVVGSK